MTGPARLLWAIGVVLAASDACDSAAAEAPTRLFVRGDQRCLVDQSGAPFFWLADTAWELLHRADRDEADRYLRDRAAKGFTVIQTVGLAELDGLRTPNAYGHTPLAGLDPARPLVRPGADNDYWDHADWVVRRANALGMVVAFLPTWGDKFNLQWGVGPVVFTPENARAYGEFLGRRYADASVVWVLGGDRNPIDAEDEAIVDAMAAGVSAGDGGRVLRTYHPRGGLHNATTLLDDREWLDLRVFQSGHGEPFAPNHAVLRELMAGGPTRPALDAEPCYEDHPINWDPQRGWYDAWHCRVMAYWAVFSGAAGHSYGNHNVWQLWQPGRDAVSNARTPWWVALDHPGARQMGHLRALATARPFDATAPDPSLLDGDVEDQPIIDRGDGAPPAALHRAACRDRRGRFALAYLPTGGAVRVRLDGELAEGVTARWFDPRQGSVEAASPTNAAEAGFAAFRSPSEGWGRDWVLVLDATPRDLPPLRPWGW
ncbi:MAG: DUF4038 domain-containing protein [Planctomycetota bacterium]